MELAEKYYLQEYAIDFFMNVFLLLYKCSGYFLKDKAKGIRNKSVEFNLDFAHVQQLDFGQITQPQ